MKGVNNDWQQRQQRLGLLCAKQNVAGSNLALYFDFFSFFEIFLSSRRISVHREIWVRGRWGLGVVREELPDRLGSLQLPPSIQLAIE